MKDERVDVLHAVTVSLSLSLMRGQLGFLRKLGFHVAALCSPGAQVEQTQAAESVPVFTVPMKREIAPVRDFISLVRIFQLLRKIRPTICNAGTPKAGLLVGLAAWFARVPCRIYTLRGLRLETAPGLKRRILATTERIACTCAHRVVCVSPSLRKRAIELKLVRPGKVIVLALGSSNGVDVSRFAPSPERLAQAAAIRRKHGIPDTAHVVGYVGRLTNDKGMSELLQAFRIVHQRFDSAVLILIGDYEPGDPLSRETREAIQRDHGIVQVPFVNDIAPYYLLMNILALPTHREGFPNTVLEAQASELPVITTGATGAVDSILPDVTGLIVPVGDADALANSLSTLLADRERARRMGIAGRERAARQFAQEIAWSALADLYCALLRERGLPIPVDKAPQPATIYGGTP